MKRHGEWACIPGVVLLLLSQGAQAQQEPVPGISTILRMASHQSAEARCWAIRELWRKHRDDSRSVLVTANRLQDAHPDVRLTAAACLGRYGTGASCVTGQLRSTLLDPVEGVRCEAAESLVLIDPQNTAGVPFLLGMLLETDNREHAAVAYSMFKPLLAPLCTGRYPSIDVIESTQVHFIEFQQLQVRAANRAERMVNLLKRLGPEGRLLAVRYLDVVPRRPFKHELANPN